ncbi:hypothetical protein ACC743_39295, partial [Rhizobium ruizarguesonis]
PNLVRNISEAAGAPLISVCDLNVERLADLEILAFGSIEEWKQKSDEHPPLSAILVNVGGKKIDEPAVSEQIRKLASEFVAT